MIFRFCMALGLACGVALADAPSHNRTILKGGKYIAVPIEDPPPGDPPAKLIAEPRPQVGAKVPAGWQLGDIVRVPFLEHKVYRAKAQLGNPIMIELPEGEIAEKIWLDETHWRTHGNKHTNRVVLSALQSPEVVGRKTFVHIETVPNHLRISFFVEAVADEEEVPGVWQVFATSEMQEELRSRQVQLAVAQAAGQIRESVEESSKANLETWKADAIEKLDERYRLSGNLPVDRVISDVVQTFILTSTQERGNVEFRNKDGKPEAVIFRLQNGKYTVDRVLVGGEKFILTVGKSAATIERR